MAKIIIFGLGDLAELSYYYLKHDSNHNVVAFTVSEDFMPKNREFKGLPVIPFEGINKLYPTHNHKFFTLNSTIATRLKIFEMIKNAGYKCISYISSKAEINNCDIGENCFIQEFNSVQPFSKIGSNVVMYSGNTVAHHSKIGNFVTLGSYVAVGSRVDIGDFCDIGANATIMYGRKLAEGSTLTLGSVLIRDTEAWNFYLGNPAKRIGNELGKKFFKRKEKRFL